MAEERKKLAATKEEQLAQMREVWGDVALNGTSEMAKIVAAEKLYDHLDGKPRQIVENLNRDMTAEKAQDQAIDIAAALRGWKPPEKE